LTGIPTVTVGPTQVVVLTRRVGARGPPCWRVETQA
jgi:hypothetical protein